MDELSDAFDKLRTSKTSKPQRKEKRAADFIKPIPSFDLYDHKGVQHALRNKLEEEEQKEKRRVDCGYGSTSTECTCDAKVTGHETAFRAVNHFLNIAPSLDSFDPRPHAYKMHRLAEGAHHDAWLVIPDEPYRRPDEPTKPPVTRFVIRIRLANRMHAGTPSQVRNEVGIRRWVTKNLSSVPCPEVYGYFTPAAESLHGSVQPYIVEEFIEGQILQDVWRQLSYRDKEVIVDQVADILLGLASTRFDFIGSIDPETGEASPHVEWTKQEEGRFDVHSSLHYDIGPYKSVEGYVKALFDREIAYYSQSEQELPCAWHQNGTISAVEYAEFLKELRDNKKEWKHYWNESFVLAHHDFSGRNLMVQGNKVVGLIDWEWASICPISQFWENVGAIGEGRRGLWLGRPRYPRAVERPAPVTIVDWHGKSHFFNLHQGRGDDRFWTLLCKMLLLEKAKTAGWKGRDLGGLMGTAVQPGMKQGQKFLEPNKIATYIPQDELLSTRMGSFFSA